MARIRSKNTNNSTNNTNNSNNTTTPNNNSYEEARKQRLQDNLKKFQDLGILKISKSLSEIADSEKKQGPGHVKPISKPSTENLELRRSSRARGATPSYREIEIDFRAYRRSNNKRSLALGRVVLYEERILALKQAEKLQSSLNSGHPSFVKSMVRSHVSSCFWLGLPTKFCKDHLPPTELKMILEDENGQESDAVYIGSRTGISGGWRGFALDHGLDDGDALVFELCKPAKFKVYIVKALQVSGQNDKEKKVKAKEENTNQSIKRLNSHEIDNEKESLPPVIKEENGLSERAKRATKRAKRE